MATYAVNLCDLSRCDLSALPVSPAFNQTALLLQDFVRQPGTVVQTNRHLVDSGDPRSAVFKLKVPSGRTNDWGQTGICVP